MILHADLFVSSMARSLAFYRDGLGAKLVEDTVVTGALPLHVSAGTHRAMRIVLLELSEIGSRLELLALADATGEVDTVRWPPHGGALSLWVSDLEGRIAALAAAGFLPDAPPATALRPGLGVVEIASYRDPDGHRIVLIGRATRAVHAGDQTTRSTAAP